MASKTREDGISANLPDFTCTAADFLQIFRRFVQTTPQIRVKKIAKIRRGEQALKTRFVKSVAETAKVTQTVMPWQRGARRAAFIAKRRAKEALRKSA